MSPDTIIDDHLPVNRNITLKVIILLRNKLKNLEMIIG
jgi:hypothetical protein